MLRLRLLVALVASLSAAACAREVPTAHAPSASLRPWFTPQGYSWPPRTIVKEDRMHPSVRAIELSKTNPITTANRAALPSDSLIPGGNDCIERLREHGARFELLPAERGVDTPIVIHGPLGGVDFWSSGGPMVVDCRLALALERVAPTFAALGISRARFSGAYVYRTSKQGRLSLHAYGLAIDMHEVTTAAGRASVSKDFVRGEACGEDAPVLNLLACGLRAQGLFRELLTPDYDADHHDHIHLGLAPLPSAERAAEASTGEASLNTKSRAEEASASESEMAPQNLKSEARAEVEPARKGVNRRAVSRKPVATNASVTRLGTNLQKASRMPGDRVDAEASN